MVTWTQVVIKKKIDGKWSDSEFILKVDRQEALVLIGMWDYVDMEGGG